ncbi:MAG: hypothetical protein JWP04_3971 [Belnapia sp.]|nr:hypothetical protein [Belnapia sp.]
MDAVVLNGLPCHFGNLTGMLQPNGMEWIEVPRPASVQGAVGG